ncbi:MAG: histidine kinase [Clostridiales bacterium]|nr:histidine kinase [Clostridiales bacterium]
MDEISIKLPAKPEYMSVARLTTASIANRIGFTVDDIEDLKLAISEASNYLINQFSGNSHLAIDYQINTDSSILAKVKLIGSSCVTEKKPDNNELSLFIIESVSDQVIKEEEQGVIYGFTIIKSGGGNLGHE